MRLKLFPKIALILIFLAALPALLVGWQTYRLNKEHLQTNILELHTNLANSLADRIGLYLDGLAGKTRAVVETMRVQGIVASDPLQAFINSNKEFISIAYVNPKGRELLKVAQLASREEQQLQDHAAQPFFLSYLTQDAKRPREPRFEFFYAGEDPRLKILFPFNPNRPAQGDFYIVATIRELWAEIAREGAGVGGGGREAFIVDGKGGVLFHSDPASGALRSSALAHPIVKEALAGKTLGSREFVTAEGQGIIGAYARVRGAGWFSIIEQPRETAYFPIYETRRRAFQVILVSILLASGVAFLLARQLSRPILAVIEGARRVARGDFDHTVHVKAKDEMRDLAKTFNDMVRELNRYNALQVDRIIEEKTKTEAVIYSIADGLILTDAAGTIQLLNDHAVRIFALEKHPGVPAGPEEPPEQFVGRNLFQIIPDPKVQEAVREILRRPGGAHHPEIRISRASYESNYQLSSEIVHTPRNDRSVGVVTVIHDVTLERQMDEMKESFLHSITHDLRNPMTSIMGFLKFLLDETVGPVNDQQKKMLDTMNRASTRLLGMINDILDVAKIEAGKLEIELAPVPLHTIVEDVQALYRPLAENKAVQLKAELPPHAGEGTTIAADYSLIERTVSNLVANAIKFTPAEGTVTLRLEDLPDRVQIAVADTGPGIPEDYKTKIFDKFQQVKGGRQGGTGLGLTICKYFVELHKGKIWVESDLGRGSRFVLWLPKGLLRGESGVISPPLEAAS